MASPTPTPGLFSSGFRPQATPQSAQRSPMGGGAAPSFYGQQAGRGGGNMLSAYGGGMANPMGNWFNMTRGGKPAAEYSHERNQSLGRSSFYNKPGGGLGGYDPKTGRHWDSRVRGENNPYGGGAPLQFSSGPMAMLNPMLRQF